MRQPGSRSGLVGGNVTYGHPHWIIDPIFGESTGNNLPVLLIEANFTGTVKDGDGGASVWTDLSTFMEEVSWSRGRSREADRYTPGQLSVRFNNQDGRFSPDSTASTYYPNIKTLKRVRVRTLHSGEVNHQIHTYADTWDEQYDMPTKGKATVTFVGTDGFKILAQAKLKTPWEQELLATTGLTHWYRMNGLQLDSVGDIHGEGTTHPTTSSLVVGVSDPAGDVQAGGFFELTEAPITSYPFSMGAWCFLTTAGADDFNNLMSQGDLGSGFGPTGVDFDFIDAPTNGGSEFSAGFDSFDGPNVGSTVVATQESNSSGYPFFVVAGWDGTTASTGTYLYVGQSRKGTVHTYNAASTVAVSTRDTAGHSFSIGDGYSADADTSWDGPIDEVVMFNRNLTVAEFTRLFTAGAIGLERTDPVGRVINGVLDSVRWPSDLRDIPLNDGVTVPYAKWRFPSGRPALAFMQELGDSDRGALFMSREGKVKWVSLETLLDSSLYNTPSVVFSSSAGAIRYAQVKYAFDDTEQINEAVITNNGLIGSGSTALTEQSVTRVSTSAQDADLARTKTLTTFVSATSEAEVLSQLVDRAEYELDQNSTSYKRIAGLVLKPMRQSTAFDTVLGLDLLQRVRVIHRTPDGRTIQQDRTIEGITHTYNHLAKDWTVELVLSAGGMKHTYWNLGSTGLSELGVTTYLAPGVEDSAGDDAYDTPSTRAEGSLMKARTWRGDVVENIRNLAEGPWVVRTSTGQSMGFATWNKVEYGTFVDGSTRDGAVISYSTTTDLFTLPQTGRYRVEATLSFQPSTRSTGGNSRLLGIATTTGAGPGAPIAIRSMPSNASTLEDLGGCVIGEALITSTTQKLSIRAYQNADNAAGIFTYTHQNGIANRVSIRWVGAV